MVNLSPRVYRYGMGLATLGALSVWLWPSDLSTLNNGGFIVGFLSTFAVWSYFELFSDRDPHPLDVETGRKFVTLSQNHLRHILRDHNMWAYQPQSNISLLFNLASEIREQDTFFIDSGIQKRLISFSTSLQRLNTHIAQHTTPTLVGGRLETGYKPDRTVTQEDFDRRQELAKQADQLASDTWHDLEALIEALRAKCPTSFN